MTTSQKTSSAELSKRLPGPRTAKWPEGERFVQGLAHGTMVVELFAPIGHDPQTPHRQDELYFIQTGSAELLIAGEPFACAPGDAFFVAAGVEHHFEKMSADFTTWVVFWGPDGGERATPER